MKPYIFALVALAAMGCSSSSDVADRETLSELDLKSSLDDLSEEARELLESERFSKKYVMYDYARRRPVAGKRGMVVSDDKVASEWGVEVLRRGGNAIDAAVATAFMLSVTRPHFASLGGGGFMVYCPRGKGRLSTARHCKIIDYRETAPEKATRDMFVRNGSAQSKLSRQGALAIGTPGVVAGLAMAHQNYGKARWSSLFERPLKLAREGIQLSGFTASKLEGRWKVFNREAKKVFGGCSKTKKGMRRKFTKPCRISEWLIQDDLAEVLLNVSKLGKKGFYEGKIAKKIARGIQREGGILSNRDLESYRPRVRTPLVRKLDDFELVAMPPPSAGGSNIVQMMEYFNQARKDGAIGAEFYDPATMHAVAHTMTLAFADRAVYFGDPDFFNVPVTTLTDPGYLKKRWQDTFLPRSVSIPERGLAPSDSEDKPSHTTHFSVIDRHGNAVSVTTTVNFPFGSGFVPPGTGILMNNEMDDFSAQPGVPNGFGLVGAEANSVAPGKRPLSSMSPTIVRDLRGNNRIVIGGAGGPRITTSVYQSLLKRLYFGMPLPDAVATPRMHHQWKPNALYLESPGVSAPLVQAMRAYGWEVKFRKSLAHQHALERHPDGTVWAANDLRSEGGAAAE